MSATNMQVNQPGNLQLAVGSYRIEYTLSSTSSQSVDLSYLNLLWDYLYKYPPSTLVYKTSRNNKRPRPHSPQTFVSFRFSIRLHYEAIGGRRWKSIKCAGMAGQN
jgi:hypothetical protein